MLGVSEGASVFDYQIADTLVEAAALNGIMLARATDGIVAGNVAFGCGGYGIEETSASAKNLIIANRVTGNGASEPLAFAGTFTQVVRNFGDLFTRIPDSGGFRQTIDGWAYDDVPANQTTGVELTRFGVALADNGRFRPARDGSVTAIVVTANDDVTAGTITVTLWKNDTGTAGAGGSAVAACTVTLSTTTPSRNAAIFAEGSHAFFAGDELFLKVTSSSSLMPVNTIDIRCAIEIED